MIENIIIVTDLIALAVVVWCIIKIINCYKTLKRNEAVYKYRMKILERRNNDFYSMPSYEDMLNSKLPLTDDNWVRENYLKDGDYVPKSFMGFLKN